MQGSQKDQYVKKLRDIVENGTKSQDTLIELTPNSGSAEITEKVLNLKPASDHDDRYETFEAFIKEISDPFRFSFPIPCVTSFANSVLEFEWF